MGSSLRGVTGSNLPRAYRRAAAAREAESEATDALEETLPAGDIEEKGLYFIETADGAGEGEFRVGVARVQGALDANGLVPVAWYTRKHTKDAAWGSGNMALVPYMVQACQRLRRVGTSSEDPEHFLPVKVELTGKSVAPTAASIAGSAVKLTMRCVDRLRAYLERRRPDLIVGGEGGGAAARTAAAASGCSAADGRGGGRGSAAGGRSRGRGKSKAAGSADSSEASRSSDADEDDESGESEGEGESDDGDVPPHGDGRDGEDASEAEAGEGAGAGECGGETQEGARATPGASPAREVESPVSQSPSLARGRPRRSCAVPQRL